jgi:hypothetical protein
VNMHSPHILVSIMSLALIVGAAGAVAIEDQRGGPPQGPARGQSAKPPKPPQAATPQQPTKPTTPAKTSAKPEPKGPQAVGPQLTRHPKLSAKLQLLLPPNTDLQAASLGFRNLGQFVAAVHVSNNLGISFDELKLRMTGPEPKSLGQSIQELRPAANADVEVKRAEAQARRDLDGRDK